MKIKNCFIKKKKEVLILSFIFAIAFLLILTFRYGNDFYWHLKAGEYMVAHQTILKTDPFSWYLKSFSPVWISHEWLFEVLLYSISHLFGNFGVIFLVFLSLLSLLFILYFTNKKGFHQNIYFTLFFLCSSIVLTLNTLPRPFLFSNLFLAFTFYLLYDLKKNEDTKKIYFLPVVALLWANFHGGSSNLCYLLVFVFYFCSFFHFSFGKIENKKASLLKRRKYLVVFFLTLFAIFINPHGIKMFFYPYQNMRDSFMLATISEWQPVNFNDPSSLLYLLLLASLLTPLLITRKKIDLTDFIVILMFTFLGFKSIRFWPFVFIAFTYVVFHYIGPCKKSFPLFDYSLIVCFFVIIVFSSFCFSMPKYDLIDPEFVHVLKKEKPKRLYNYYDYGGYLLSCDIPVFVDGRADLYASYHYQDYYQLSTLRGDYELLLKKYDFDYFLVDKGIPLAYYLRNQTDYQVLLEKGNTILYTKKEGQ